MARKAGQIISRGASTWLVRVYLGRDPQTGTRKYHNQTIHGPFREAQRFLNLNPLSPRRYEPPKPTSHGSAIARREHG
jgi:hypothetical protein